MEGEFDYGLRLEAIQNVRRLSSYETLSIIFQQVWPQASQPSLFVC